MKLNYGYFESFSWATSLALSTTFLGNNFFITFSSGNSVSFFFLGKGDLQ